MLEVVNTDTLTYGEAYNVHVKYDFQQNRRWCIAEFLYLGECSKIFFSNTAGGVLIHLFLNRKQTKGMLKGTWALDGTPIFTHISSSVESISAVHKGSTFHGLL